MVLGASGSGKSSLVRPGILPRLRTREDWHADSRTAGFFELLRASIEMEQSTLTVLATMRSDFGVVSVPVADFKLLFSLLSRV